MGMTKARPTKSRKNHARSRDGPKKDRVKELVFDPEARREHLRGFSERKRQRRAFGLAMQKVKDRNGKLEARRDRNNASKQQVLCSEQQKEPVVDEKIMDDYETVNLPPNNPVTINSVPRRITEYRDQITEDQWGGHVVVTTSTSIPDDDEDGGGPKDEGLERRRRTDAAQEYAGKVERYLDELKGNMPSKRKHLNIAKGTRSASRTTEAKSRMNRSEQNNTQRKRKGKVMRK